MDPFATEPEGPTVKVSLKNGPSYQEDWVSFNGSPDDLAKLFGISEADWDGKASTLLKQVKAVGDWTRKLYGSDPKA